ncbi:polyphosphate:AMP phosphotransferase [Verticiella alkaliphila]|uniref:polyphosphate:AMP phosphotransferase n=1 Tax=Verticiella alkaliphila TaxID=2779529 RepID=UPI0035301509
MKPADLLDHAENDPALAQADFEAQETSLRTDLLLQQFALLEKADRAVLFVIAGVDGAGKGSAIHLLNEWLDPRHVRTLAFGKPTPEEAARPAAWRYWRGLPARGRIGVVFGSWYTPILREAARRKPDAERLEAALGAARQFEAQLRADGVHVVKLWFHLSRDAQRARCERLAADPETAWRVSDEDRQVASRFGRLRKAAEHVIAHTHEPAAPWRVIPSADDNLRAVVTATTVLQALRHPLPAPARAPKPEAQGAPRHRLVVAGREPGMGKRDYHEALAEAQARLGRAVRLPEAAKRSLVIVFEGVDAAGKGGAVRRVVRSLDVRRYDIIPIAAPNEEERAYPYLWRFWRHAPTPGRAVIFDRSWYGRVLVERVERFAAPADWQRAYEEINAFEAQWKDHGAIVVKFWLEISREEQLTRFRAREQTPFKHFKITPEDWRNRGKHKAYRAAALDMLALTDTPHAPWHVVATDDKRAARVQVLTTLADAVEAALGESG